MCICIYTCTYMYAYACVYVCESRVVHWGALATMIIVIDVYTYVFHPINM